MLLDQLVCGLKQCIRLHLLNQCKTLTLEIDIAQTMESELHNRHWRYQHKEWKSMENILNVQSEGYLNCYCCEGKHLSQTWQIQNISFATRKDRLEVWKAKMNNSFIQGKDNLVQEAKFSEYVVFKVYYQSVSKGENREGKCCFRNQYWCFSYYFK